MMPGAPRILTCPHCGGKKQVLSLMSGNTFGMQLWSDNKQVCPMLPKVSFVQKCPYCGEYFLLSRQKGVEYGENSFSSNEGRLTYDELKEAYNKLSKELELTDDERLEFLFYLLWGFNDKFWRNEDPIITKEGREYEKYIEIEGGVNDDELFDVISIDDLSDKEDTTIDTTTQEQENESEQERPLPIPSKDELAYHEGVVLELLKKITDPLLSAELYREIGYFDKAKEFVLKVEAKNDFQVSLKTLIIDAIDHHDKSVIELTDLLS